MQHVLITRFSVPSVLGGKMWRVDGNREYMEYRLGLFEKFCFPSVKCQTCRNFVWFVLFSRESTDIVRNWVSDHQDTQLFIPLFSPSFDEAMGNIRLWVQVNVPVGEQVITSRFDNDDALAARYIERIQQTVDIKSDKMYIDSIEGHQVLAKSASPMDWQFYWFRYWANPFISMVERVTSEPIKTVYHCKHGSIKQPIVDCPVVAIQGVQWLQVLHGKNIGNRKWGNRQVAPALQEFPWLMDLMNAK